MIPSWKFDSIRARWMIPVVEILLYREIQRSRGLLMQQRLWAHLNRRKNWRNN